MPGNTGAVNTHSGSRCSYWYYVPMRFSRVLSISRPRFWLYEAGTFLVGVAAAYALTGQAEIFLLLPVVAFFFYFLIPANILIYGVNDIYDYETDRLNPKKANYEALVHPHEHPKLWLWILGTNIPFLLFLYGASVAAIVSFMVFVCCAVGYSMPPVRAKARPILDSLFSAGHYVATGVFGYFLAGGEGFAGAAVIAALSWAMAMHAYSAVPDIEADGAAHLATVATLLGRARTILLCFGFYVLSSILAYPYIGIAALVLGVVYGVLMLLSLYASDARLFAYYRIFPVLNALSGMLLFFLILLR